MSLTTTGAAPPDPADVVRVGAGSYTTRLPAGAKEPGAAPWTTASVRKPVPTNDWWSSLVFLRYSNQMFPHPLGVQAGENGLRITYPGAGYTANREGVFTAVMRAPDDLTIGRDGEETFPDARVDSWSDWFVTAAFGAHLRLTFGHGSPFVYGVVDSGAATVAFGRPPVVFAGGAGDATLGVSVDGRHYGLFGPSGSRWDGIGTGRLVCRNGGKPWFSVALLPDNRPETLAAFARVAHNHVTDTRVTWTYDPKKSSVTTRYAFTLKAYEPGAPGTLFTLLPHHQIRSQDPLTAYTYRCARGVLKVAAGDHFTTVTPFTGVLPLLPPLDGAHRAALTRHLAADADAFRPQIADTYWTGKALGKLATLSALADTPGDRAAADTFHARLKGLLEDYLTASPGESKGLFYHNRTWGTLIGYPASYGSDESLNDHHFHYGYFVRAAAEVARREPAWAAPQRWGGMVRMLLRDCANPDRDDPLFPFLRNFDLYEGHTWADGKGDFADGNNNESSSEAMNAWTGMILWGELTGDTRLRDTGIFLYATEKDAIEQYWFDVDQRYPPQFTPGLASMVWGAKAAYATWFSGDPIHMHGINVLPVQSGSLYLGARPDAIRRNLQVLERERTAYDTRQKRDPSLPPRTGKDWGGWGDIVFMFQALADPAAALAACDIDRQEIEDGNSRANLYHWLHLMDRLGQTDPSVTADTPLFAVFRKDGRRTYVVYNTAGRPRSVAFSDGRRITAKPGLTVAGPP